MRCISFKLINSTRQECLNGYGLLPCNKQQHPIVAALLWLCWALNLPKNDMRDKLQRKIDQAKSCNMSNAKWRKFFLLVEESGFNVIRSNWKYIDNDRIYEKIGFPDGSDLVEDGLSDGRWAPISFKSIEYISIPKHCESLHQDPKRPLPKVKQPIFEINEFLQPKAKFPLVLSEAELRLQAYEI